MTDDLTKAIAELRRDGPVDEPWTASLVADGNPYQSSLAGAVATTLNAALSGDLIPKADADLAVALMVEPLLKLREGIEADIRSAHHGRGNGSSSAMREDDRDFRAAVAAAFDALAPDAGTAALAELQALRDDRDRLDAVTNTLSEMWEGEKASAEAAEVDITTYQEIVADMTQEAEAAEAERDTWREGSRVQALAHEAAEAELATLRAQVERLTVKPLLFSELVDGGCMGRPHPFQYFITKNHNGRFLCHWDETWHDTLPEAQAHAQKAYQIAALTEGAAP